jgi:hypothetical protein
MLAARDSQRLHPPGDAQHSNMSVLHVAFAAPVTAPPGDARRVCAGEDAMCKMQDQLTRPVHLAELRARNGLDYNAHI